MTVITGGTGFIGAHLIEMMAAAGESVRAVVRRDAAFPPGVEPARCDLTQPGSLDEALRGADTVIHLAGVTKALRAADYYAGNLTATENLARAAAGRGLRFVHVSSLAAAGPSPDGRPITEDAEPRPVTHYGKSKLEAERAVRHSLPDAVIVRPPVVYGPRDRDVFQLLKSISKGLVLEIAGGERWFSAIYVTDLCAGLAAAARSPRAAGRTYFLSHPKPLSWTEFGAAAARILGRTPRVVKIPIPVAQTVGAFAEMWSRVTGTPGIISRDKVREARSTHWTCDTRRATEELGFTPRTDIEAGLAEALAWYKGAGWL
jgi:nucleoside-diphosphate-sugar epimerase